MHGDFKLILLGSGVLASAIYLFSIVYAAAAYPGYRHRSQFISELGTNLSPRAIHFNMGLAATGILLVIFAFGVGLSLAGSRFALSILLGLALFGLAVALMACFPCDPDCPRVPTSRAGMTHGLLGLLGALALAAATVLLSLTWWSTQQPFAIYSLVTALLSVFLLMALMVLQKPQWQGMLQRFYTAVAFSWVLVLSVVLLVQYGRTGSLCTRVGARHFWGKFSVPLERRVGHSYSGEWHTASIL